MDTLLHLGLVNAVLATALALVAAVGSRVCRRPALRHSLWLLVLVKLVTPPLVSVQLPWPVDDGSTPAVSVSPETVATKLSSVPEAAERAPVVPGDEDLALDVVDPPAMPAPALPRAEFVNTETTGTATPFIQTADSPVTLPRWGVVSRPRLNGGWEPIVGALWLSGSALWYGLAGLRLYRFGRLLRFARPAPPTLQEQGRRLAVRLGLARCPGIWLVDGPVSPLLWALAGGPRLLLPHALWDRLTEAQQDTLLIHELAHLRRRDHWIRRLELVVLGLYWWHPVAWWARRELREAEEQCCDAWVVWTLPEAAESYAAALIETVTFFSEARFALPPAASGVGQVRHLKRRLTMILRVTTPQKLGGLALLPVLALAALLPLRPTWAQTGPPIPAGADEPAAPPVEVRSELPPSNSTPVTPAPEKTTQNRRTYLTGPSQDTLQDAQDDVELLKAQLDAKTAEVAEVKALLQNARRQLQRQERLHTQNAASENELEQARSDVAVMEARLQAKTAQVREAQVRLKQGERRLAAHRRPETGPATVAPSPKQPTAAPGVAPAVAPPAVENAPASPEKPAAAAPRNGSTPGLGRPPTQDGEQRLRDVERKLDDILKEVEALRRELRQSKAGAAAVPSTPAPSYVLPLPRSSGVPEAPKNPDPRNTPTVPLEKKP